MLAIHKPIQSIQFLYKSLFPLKGFNSSSSFFLYPNTFIARSFSRKSFNSSLFTNIGSSPKTNLTITKHSPNSVQQHIRNLTMASATSIYEFEPLNKKGDPTPLADYKGKVLLIVNTASKCGFTPQYEGLEKLYKGMKEKHGDDFVILGFPCNQFGGQDPGTDEEIQSFCQINYGVSFPIMKKVDVNGDSAAPLFKWLKEEKPGLLGLQRVKWNFEKWLVGRDGKVKQRWASTTKPESLEKPILEALNETKSEL
ncbi:a3c43204-3b5d-4363-9ebe-e9592d478cd0 [Sclerotinia trifoliorum]|uniref:Glutathione peroxidase n=1 Tax=Sclerotinia trifoliorum TaxID=28548 RepID=A0A8H2VME3_9HELO|nr:a3c43204-3b5d-4363-9ebe-e9592d478cd0 [Sclerotinia trifoliorum]